jgi:predicted Zn-dependent peptidase
MRAYFDRRYVAPNILVSVAGNIDWPAFVGLLDGKCGRWAGGDAPRYHLTETSGVGGTHAAGKDSVAQEHVLLFSPGPAVESPLRYAAATVAVAVGDDSGSRLHWELVDPGHVESASCGNDQNQASGVTVTSFSCDPAKAGENLATVRRLLADLQRDGLTAEELAQAKNKIASRVVRASERPGGRMRAIAASWLYLNEYCDVDQELARFDAVGLDTVRECLDRYPLDRPTVFGYGPLAAL